MRPGEVLPMCDDTERESAQAPMYGRESPINSRSIGAKTKGQRVTQSCSACRKRVCSIVPHVKRELKEDYEYVEVQV